MRSAFLSRGKREPLFPLHEVADRLGCPMLALRGLMSKLREESPRARCTSLGSSLGSGRVGMYPMSEFRKWAAHHNIDFKVYACRAK